MLIGRSGIGTDVSAETLNLKLTMDPMRASITPRETLLDELRPATRPCESSSPGTGNPRPIHRRHGAVLALRHQRCRLISNVYPNADTTPTIVVKAGLPLSLRALYRLSRPRPVRCATRDMPRARATVPSAATMAWASPSASTALGTPVASHRCQDTRRRQMERSVRISRVWVGSLPGFQLFDHLPRAQDVAACDALSPPTSRITS